MERPFPAYKGDDPYIFVSYSHEDAEHVYPEIQRLKDQGFNIWYDEGINAGSTWRDEVALALTQCKVFLFYITPRSVASSNCLKEVNFSLSRERRMLCVHFEQTELPIGLELSLSDMQAIIRSDHTQEAYQDKLADSLRLLLPAAIAPVPLPVAEKQDEGSGRQSIAILPLVNRNLDSEDEYLCDGIAEELISGLSRVKGLRVASQLSSFSFKNHQVDIANMGEKLRVDHILSGSVQKAGNRIRISVLLSRVEDESSLWSERYDREVDDIFELQEEVARQVIDALKLELDIETGEKLVDVGTTNVEAYNAYLMGRAETSRLSRGAVVAGIKHLEQAVEIDSAFAAAHWLLGNSYLTLVNTFGEEDVKPKARSSLIKSRSLGYVDRFIPWIEIDYQLDPELRPDRRTLARTACDQIRSPLTDGNQPIHGLLSQILFNAGLFSGALKYAERWFELINLSAAEDHLLASVVKYCLSGLGRYEEAIEQYTQFLSLFPDNHIARGDRIILCNRTGQYTKAEQDLEIIGNVWPKNFPRFHNLFWRGEIDEAREYFEWLESRRNLELLYKTYGWFVLDELDKGLDYFERFPGMLEQSRFRLRYYCQKSTVAAVDDHPRYQNLMQDHGLGTDWQRDLLDMVNELSDVTGIDVQQDDIH